MTNVRAGSLVFWGGGGQDGFYIRADGLKGLGSVGVRGETFERPQAHGDFDVPVFRTSRFVTIEGPCIADSAERLDHYKAQLSGLLGGGESGRVVFDTPSGARWGDARLSAQEFDETLWGQRADYMLRLKFANPRLFGESHSFGPALTVAAHHYGNFAASPVLTVSGVMPGYSIHGAGGKVFTVTKPVTAGHPHVIDMASGFLRVDGAIVYGAISRGDCWSIPGGAAVSQTLAPVSGSGALAVSVTDTYI